MKKIKLYTAVSLDGYIARTDGDLDWISDFSSPEKTDYGYRSFFESTDTVIIDESSYLNILSMDIIWPYKDKPVYVVSSMPMNAKDNIHFITDDIIDSIDKLREEEGKDIWLACSSKLLTMLLNHDMIDEMTINRFPVILGFGMPLFSDNPKESEWRVKNNVSYQNGITQTIYTK